MELWVRQAPADGAANAAVIDHVAHWLKVPRSSVRLVSGGASRSKRLDIEGLAVLPLRDTVL